MVPVRCNGKNRLLFVLAQCPVNIALDNLGISYFSAISAMATPALVRKHRICRVLVARVQ